MLSVISKAGWRRPLLACALILGLTACNAERRKSDAELGLNATQAAGRRIFDNSCARCHEPYSASALHGPPLKGMYKKQELPSGKPANDDRVRDVILMGKAKMPAYRQVLNDQQVDELIAYLHTL